MNNIELLKNGIEGFNIDTNDSMLEKFKIYREILVEWNKKMNLTGIEDEKEVYIKHFLDSISAVKNGYIKNGMSIIELVQVLVFLEYH
nr:RsmG family class I SAM-dependent methyltransferase [Clostridioides difficile]